MIFIIGQLQLSFELGPYIYNLGLEKAYRDKDIKKDIIGRYLNIINLIVMLLNLAEAADNLSV